VTARDDMDRVARETGFSGVARVDSQASAYGVTRRTFALTPA